LIGFFGILLPPLEVTRGRFQESDRVFESPEPSIAAVAKESSNDTCAVVMVDCKPTHAPTTTPVPSLNPADGAVAILLVKKSLVLLRGKPHSSSLVVLIRQNQTIPTKVLPLGERRKVCNDLFQPTALAHRLALSDKTVLHSMKSLPNQL
jgi:hypothetical protein